MRSQKTTYISTCVGSVCVVRKKIKNMYLRISNGEITVTAPLGFSDKTILSFINSRTDWLQKKLSAQPSPSLLPQNDSLSHITVWGEALPLWFSDKITHPKIDGCGVSFPMECSKDERLMASETALFYKQVLLEAFDEVCKSAEQSAGYAAAQWRFRAMKTRFGSCNSAARRITLNTGLAKFSKDFLYCVICHELAHLMHPNHSQAFYAELERICPGYKQRIKQFK